MSTKLHEIEWYDTYELGFSEIDKDHHTLVNIANDIIKALNKKNYETCARLSADFVNVLKEHYPKEENFLKKIGYKKLEQHIGYHHIQLAQAEEFVSQCQDECDAETLEQSMDTLVKGLLADVRGGDLEFRTFLLEKGLDKALIEERFGSIWL